MRDELWVRDLLTAVLEPEPFRGELDAASCDPPSLCGGTPCSPGTQQTGYDAEAVYGSCSRAGRVGLAHLRAQCLELGTRLAQVLEADRVLREARPEVAAEQDRSPLGPEGELRSIRDTESRVKAALMKLRERRKTLETQGE